MPNPTATIFMPYHALDEVILRGTRASQQLASAVTPGSLYCVTDEGARVERSSGLIWEAFGPSAQTGVVFGPALAVTDHLASYADTTGVLIKDSGIPSAQVARRDQANTFEGNVTVNGAFAATQGGIISGGELQVLNSLYVQSATVLGAQLTVTGPTTMQSSLTLTGSPATVSAGNIVTTLGGNSLADLTCGSTNFTAGLYVSAGAVTMARGVDTTCGWNLFTTAPIYPGQLNAAPAWQKQTSWYIAGHSSYGLYANTGMYFAAGIWTVGTSYMFTTVFSGYIYPYDLNTAGTQSSYYLAYHGGYPSGAMYVNTNFSSAGYLLSNGVIYPGNVSTGTWQTSWYIASHSSWGLYAPTGFYIATVYSTGLYITSYSTGWYLGAWPSGLYTNVSFKSAGHFYPGNRDDMYLSADASGTFTNTTFQARQGHIQCTHYMYPGAVTNLGAIQSSWYLSAHSSYGLYSNTGLYLEGGLWTPTAYITTCAVSSVLSTAYMRCMCPGQARSASTWYYAYQDGFVIVKGYYGNGGNVYVYLSTGEFRGEMGGASGFVGLASGTLVVPIRYGETYQAYIVGNAGITAFGWYGVGSYTG